MNATPEDILGLQTRSFESVEKTTPTEAAEQPSDAGAKTREGPGGSKPMEAFEERAAMASEVLRATSDRPRSHRRHKHSEAESGDSPVDPDAREETEEDPDEDVRFSEDMTISSKRRPRRKLFGR